VRAIGRCRLVIRFVLGIAGWSLCLGGSDAAADPLPTDYWRLPLPAQGDAPAAWQAIERSLRPEACGTCHADQYVAWRGSRHAQAFSPGVSGQLWGADAADATQCLACHAPLAEQRAAFLARRSTTTELEPDRITAEAGNSCASCHVRLHRRYGPPDLEDFRSTGDAAHGGAVQSSDFEQSAFCAACHQFPAATAINGKPLENTLVEWQASEFGRARQTCQSCHMPERQHLWRGIHDPAMVAAGLTPTVAATSDGVEFSLRSSNIGHAFPTYVTPKVVMRGLLIDEHGAPVPDSAVAYVIQRVVDYRDQAWVEISDTRLKPGETATLALAWGHHAKARVWLDVVPDDYYHERLYPALLAELDGAGPAARQVALADAAAAASAYRLFETEIDRPP